MTVVIDASAAFDLLLWTERGPAVADALLAINAAHAPELIDLEALSAIRRVVRRGSVDTETAGRFVRDLGELPIIRHRHSTLRERVWQLRDRMSAYDASYTALAEQLDATLLTTDARLARAARGLVALAMVL